MTEITRTDLLKLFARTQEIDNIRSNGGDICFDARNHTPYAETEKTIRLSDLEDIEDFFASVLHSRPFAKHLLQVLWIREVKFAMGALDEDDMYDFIHSAFDLYGIDIDKETTEDEFFALEREGYLQPTISTGMWAGDEWHFQLLRQCLR